jgi:hypothetical protein
MFKNSNKAILAAVGAALLVESGRADIFTVSFTNTVGSLTYGAGGLAFSGTQPGSGTLSGATSSGGVASTTGTLVAMPQWNAADYAAQMPPGLTAQLIGVTYSIVGTMYGTYTINNTTSGTLTADISWVPGTFRVRGANASSPLATVAPGTGPANSNWNYVDSGGTTRTGVNNTATTVSSGVPNSVRSQFDDVSEEDVKALYVRYNDAYAADGAGSTISTGGIVSGTTPALISALASASDNTRLPLYTGPGTVDFNVRMVAAPNSSLVQSGSGLVGSSINTFVGATIVVTYTYVPEASTMAAAGAMVLGAGFTIARRRRSKA